MLDIRRKYSQGNRIEKIRNAERKHQEERNLKKSEQDEIGMKKNDEIEKTVGEEERRIIQLERGKERKRRKIMQKPNKTFKTMFPRYTQTEIRMIEKHE